MFKKKKRLPDYDHVSHLGQTRLSLQYYMARSPACTFFQCGQPPNYVKLESAGFKTISHCVRDQVTQVHGWICPKQLLNEAIVSASQRKRGQKWGRGQSLHASSLPVKKMSHNNCKSYCNRRHSSLSS